MSEASETSSAGIRVLAKGVAVLQLISEHPGWSARQIADQLGEPRSSVYRLLSTLADLDLIRTSDSESGYRIGLQMFRLGSAAVRDLDVRGAASSTLVRLRDETDNTVYLSIRDGDQALCIDRADGRWVLSNILQIGTTIPLHIGATGKALLAFETTKFQERYIDAGPATFTEYSVVDPEALRQALAEIRKSGISVSDEEGLRGMAAIGAPIFDHSGAVCAAISIGSTKPEILGSRRDLNAELITEAAREISSRLGYTPAAPQNLSLPR